MERTKIEALKEIMPNNYLQLLKGRTGFRSKIILDFFECKEINEKVSNHLLEMSIEMAQIESLKRKLPNNYIKKITELSGLSQSTVTRFFSFKTNRTNNAEDIYDAALQLIKEHDNRKKSREKLIKKKVVSVFNGQRSLEF